MWIKLGKAFVEGNNDPETKFITITGVDDFFTSGNDLNNWRGKTTAEIQGQCRGIL